MKQFQTYTEVPKGKTVDWNNILKMLPYFRDYFGRIFFALSSLVAAKLVTVGAPLIFKEIIDSLDTAKKPLILPLALLLAYGSLRIANSLFTELRASIFARVRYRAMRRLSTNVLAHLHSLALRFHLERKTGAISRDLERGTRSVSTILNYLSFNILPSLIEFFLVAGILFQKYSFWFPVVVSIAVGAYALFTIYVTEWRMHYRLEMNALDSEANTHAIDSMINYETVKYFNNDELEVKNYDQTLRKWEDVSVKSQVSMSFLNFGQGTIIALGVTAIMVLAVQGVTKGVMTIGDLVLVNALLLQLFMPLSFLGVVYRQIKYSLADMDLIFQLLEKQPEIIDHPGATNLDVGNGVVCFEQVDFTYQPERGILENITFDIPQGKKIAVVGPSGAGKSTLVRLLFRFYDVSAGKITINGQNIREVKQQSLRKAIGIVPQDTVLFNETLLYNISYANPNATSEEIIHATKAANIHDFIESLPDGYNTIVGERGLKLSGGEKQRVAIARVILKNPKIMVFDEATSALDSHSEQNILTALDEVSQNHTTLVIAHRLSTIVDSDRILVMEQGRIVESGSHEALLKQGKLYAKMWETQQKEHNGKNGSR